jgi:hypothetical protein
MERFELTIVAQGSQSVWVAVIVIGLLCGTVAAIAISYAAVKSSNRPKRLQRRTRS